MKAIVLDCSVVFSFFFEDEQNAYADTVKSMIRSGTKAMLPALFIQEVSNALLVNMRKKRWRSEAVENFFRYLHRSGFEIQAGLQLFDLGRVYDLAVRHQLTTYDATYLDLALELCIPLATQDKALKTAAIQENCFFKG